MSFSNKLQRTDGSSDGSEINRLGDDQTIFVKSLDKIIEELQENFARVLTESEYGKAVKNLKIVEYICSGYQRKNAELSAENEVLKSKLKEMEINLPTIEQPDERQDSMEVSNSLSDGAIVFGNCYYRRKRGTKTEYVICVFSLCDDVLCDVFQFGTRRQLSALESIGRFFQYVIDKQFAKKPFLVHPIKTIFDRHVGNYEYDEYEIGWEQILSAPGIVVPREKIKDEQVSGVELENESDWRKKVVFVFDAKICDLPPYVRFKIKVVQHYVVQEQFKLLSPLLLQLKPAFEGSLLEMSFDEIVQKDQFEYLLQNLLPFFASCKRYKFRFGYNSGEACTFLASLLRLPSIDNASSFDIFFCHYDRNVATTQQLPIEAISNWLHKPAIGELSVDERENRSLDKIILVNIKIQNMSECVEHLKKVFRAAKFPVQPYTLVMVFDFERQILDQTIQNSTSQEELSICTSMRNAKFPVVTIKRSRKMNVGVKINKQF